MGLIRSIALEACNYRYVYLGNRKLVAEVYLLRNSSQFIFISDMVITSNVNMNMVVNKDGQNEAANMNSQPRQRLVNIFRPCGQGGCMFIQKKWFYLGIDSVSETQKSVKM